MALGPLSAVLAEQGSGVGVALQLSWATWFATAAFQIDCHVGPDSDAVMTLEAVSRPAGSGDELVDRHVGVGQALIADKRSRSTCRSERFPQQGVQDGRLLCVDGSQVGADGEACFGA